MKYNLSIPEIIGRYLLVLIIVIVGGIYHQLWIMLLSIPIVITALSGWSPIYQVFNINHAVRETKEEGEHQHQKIDPDSKLSHVAKM